MRVIELKGRFFRERVPVCVSALESPRDIGERARHQEILLNEPQPLTHAGGVIRIQNAVECFRGQRVGKRSHEIAAAELPEVETVGRRGCPQPEGIYGLPAVTDHRAIEWDSEQAGLLAGHGPQGSPANFEAAVQPDFYSLVRPRDLP